LVAVGAASHATNAADRCHKLSAGAPPEEEQAAWLHSVVVEQRYRGRGVGRQLMAFLEQRAQQTNCREIGLQVLALNESGVQMCRHLDYGVQ